MDFTLLAAGATGRAVQKEYYFFRYGIHITCEVREKTKNMRKTDRMALKEFGRTRSLRLRLAASIIKVQSGVLLFSSSVNYNA